MGFTGGKKMAHFGDFVRMRNTTIYGIAASEQRILRRPKGFYLQLIERGWRGTMLFGLTVFSAQYFMKICDDQFHFSLRKAGGAGQDSD